MFNNRLVISFFLLILSFVFNPQTILAKSGCCSSHSGVNCSAGPQSNGKVICNDGWRGSSCLYSEMAMCGGSSYTSTTTTKTTPVPTHTTIPKPTYTSTPTPTKAPTKTPTPSKEITSEPTSISNYVQESENESSSGEEAVLLSLVGGIIYLFKKFKK